MQSTGQGAKHNSQPVHSAAITVCISLAAPMMASTGQAAIHFTQPMQFSSSINATCLGLCAPKAGFNGFGGIFNNAANSAMPSSPPGGHWLISASPVAMASA
jgi:hypothetical protein